jgi:hypothetical protein
MYTNFSASTSMKTRFLYFFFLIFILFRLTALKNLLSGDVPPSRVIEKNLDAIANYNVLQRDDSMVLYAPPIQPDAPSNKTKLTFEIVLFRPATENGNSSYR